MYAVWFICFVFSDLRVVVCDLSELKKQRHQRLNQINLYNQNNTQNKQNRHAMVHLWAKFGLNYILQINLAKLWFTAWV